MFLVVWGSGGHWKRWSGEVPKEWWLQLCQQLHPLSVHAAKCPEAVRVVREWAFLSYCRQDGSYNLMMWFLFLFQCHEQMQCGALPQDGNIASWVSCARESHGLFYWRFAQRSGTNLNSFRPLDNISSKESLPLMHFTAGWKCLCGRTWKVHQLLQGVFIL